MKLVPHYSGVLRGSASGLRRVDENDSDKIAVIKKQAHHVSSYALNRNPSGDMLLSFT
jgi:hypothetical protein